MNNRRRVFLALGTCFYVGYLPFIPGTFASLAALPLFYFFGRDFFSFSILSLALILLGFLVSGRAEAILGRKDPRYIVIDEVSGMCLSLFLIPYDLKLVIIAFFLFRLLDTLKPYPAGMLQELKGSAGIMADDLIAGIYTNLILHLVIKAASFMAS